MSQENALQKFTPSSAPDRYRASVISAVPNAYESEQVEPPVPLSHYLWILRRHRWKIFSFIAACVAATVIISARLTPIYQATVTIDIDRQGPTGVLGQESARTNTNDADQFLATQMKLIQSDSVLRPVVKKLRLVEVDPEAFDRVQAPAAASAEAPLALKRLKVVRPPNTYLLLISYRCADPGLAADVANGVAQSYVEHTYNIRYRSSASLSAFMEKQLEELKVKMERSGEALAQFERELNVINPEERTSIISSRLMQLNTEYTAAQADRVRKQAAADSIASGSMEAAQVSSQGEALKRISERLDDASQKFADVKSHFGPNHPEYRRAADQVAEIQRQIASARQNIGHRVEIEYQQSVAREKMLAKAVADQKGELDRINTRAVEYQSLKREAEADKKLYEELVHKIKEAGINASFQNSSIRVADPARPPVKPVSPNIKLNALIALLLATVIAVATAIVTDLIDDTIRDPEQAQRSLSAPVIATLPCVRSWKNSLNPAASAANPGTAIVPASHSQDMLLSSYSEAVRTLRNSLLLSDFDRRLRSLLVTSASPGEGKSTAAAHLAVAHAEQGLKTLLIDGDLRRPSIAKRFNLPGAKGLSNVLMDEVEWHDVLQQIDGVTDLDVLAAGPPSRRAADLIGRGLFELLEEACREYDLVILDGPPLPGFAEPLQMATSVDGVIVVTRAGQTSRKAIHSMLSTLGRLRANVVGLVLNQVKKDMSQSYHYYGHYSKYYQAGSRA